MEELLSTRLTTTSPLCRFCEEEDETFPHLLLECPCFQETRSEIILTRNTQIEDWEVKNILKMANIPAIKDALSFDTAELEEINE